MGNQLVRWWYPQNQDHQNRNDKSTLQSTAIGCIEFTFTKGRRTVCSHQVVIFENVVFKHKLRPIGKSLILDSASFLYYISTSNHLVISIDKAYVGQRFVPGTCGVDPGQNIHLPLNLAVPTIVEEDGITYIDLVFAKDQGRCHCGDENYTKNMMQAFVQQIGLHEENKAKELEAHEREQQNREQE